MNQQEHEFVNLLNDFETLHGEQLAEFLGVSESQVRMIRESLQRQGVMICSGYKGYWLTSDIKEWEENLYNNLGKRAKSLFYTMHKGVRQRVIKEMYDFEFSNEVINAWKM